MNQSPLISVIIPTLNEEKFLPPLLDSLVQQTNRDFEVIVVDGSSKDKTVKVANSYKKALPWLKTVISKNANLPLQRNIGAQHAKGKYLVFSDADNIFFPYFIERITNYINKTSAPLFTCWCSPDTEKTNDAIIAIFSNLIVEGSLLVKRQFTPGPLTVVSRAAYEAIGGYTNGLVWGEDYDFGRKASQKGIGVSVIKESLYIWSMRRFRNEGTLNILRRYTNNILLIIFTKKGVTRMPGYIMGGHIYGKKNKKKVIIDLKLFQQKINKFLGEIKEIFEE